MCMCVYIYICISTPPEAYALTQMVMVRDYGRGDLAQPLVLRFLRVGAKFRFRV